MFGFGNNNSKLVELPLIPITERTNPFESPADVSVASTTKKKEMKKASDGNRGISAGEAKLVIAGAGALMSAAQAKKVAQANKMSQLMQLLGGLNSFQGNLPEVSGGGMK